MLFFYLLELTTRVRQLETVNRGRQAEFARQNIAFYRLRLCGPVGPGKWLVNRGRHEESENSINRGFFPNGPMA